MNPLLALAVVLLRRQMELDQQIIDTEDAVEKSRLWTSWTSVRLLWRTLIEKTRTK